MLVLLRFCNPHFEFQTSSTIVSLSGLDVFQIISQPVKNFFITWSWSECKLKEAVFLNS